MSASTALIAPCLVAAVAHAADGGTLDKINATGRVVIGVRENSPPMAYALGPGTPYVGYHVELCERVLSEIAPKAKLEYMVTTAQNTLSLTQNGSIDMGCGPTTHNLTRHQQVAFSLTTYVSQVRIATRTNSGINSVEQLAGHQVVATAGTTAIQLLRKHEKTRDVAMKTMFGRDHQDSFLMLESGRADAFVLDDNLLAGIIANSKNPAAYRIVGEALGSEPIALVFRKDDPAFKAVVDSALRRMMKNGDVEKLYNKWFMSPIPPRQTNLRLPMSATLKKLLRDPNDEPLETFNK